MDKLVLNIVTFVPETRDIPRILLNPSLKKMLLDSGVDYNLYVNGTQGINYHKIADLIRREFVNTNLRHLHVSEVALPLGYCRNQLMYEAINQGCTHIINLDDDDYLERIDCIKYLVTKLPDDFIYIQRYKDNHFFPSVAGDTADYLLQGKFISNGYACMVMPLRKMIKYRLSFPEMVDTYEDNMFYLNLLMKYDGEFVMLANPYYRQVTHLQGEFSMTTKASDKLMKEEYRYIDFVTKFDSYVPRFRKIVECHGDKIYELDKNELIKFEKLYGYSNKVPTPSLFYMCGQFIVGPKGCSTEIISGVPEVILPGGVRLQVARIVTLEEFLKYNSYYTTYRLISKHDYDLRNLRDAIKARYFSKNSPIPKEYLDINIIMLTSWNLLSE